MEIDLLSLIIGVLIGLFSFGFGAVVMNWLLRKRDKSPTKNQEVMSPELAKEIQAIVDKKKVEKKNSDED
jgi:hypothetical protein